MLCPGQVEWERQSGVGPDFSGEFLGLVVCGKAQRGSQRRKTSSVSALVARASVPGPGAAVRSAPMMVLQAPVHQPPGASGAPSLADRQQEQFAFPSLDTSQGGLRSPDLVFREAATKPACAPLGELRP